MSRTRKLFHADFALPTLAAMLVSACLAPAALGQQPAQPSKGVGVEPVSKFSPVDDKETGNAALFVGINQFTMDEHLAPLRYAVNDAVAMAHLFVLELKLVQPQRTLLALSGEPDGDAATAQLAALKAAGVRVGRAFKADIFKCLQQVIATPTRQQDILIVGISSHGFEDGGVPYVMPAEGLKAFLADTAINLTNVEQALAKSKAGKRLLILDACREKPLAGGRGGDAPMAQSFKDALAKATGQAVLASCDVGEVSFEDESARHGVFTRYLLDALRGEAPTDEKGMIRIDQVIGFVAGNVERWSKQHGPQVQRPWFKGPQVAREIPLAMDAARVAALAETLRLQTAQVRARLESLKKLAIEDQITVEQHQLGKRLLGEDPSRLDARDRERLDYFLELVTGKIPANRLQKLLDSVETPEQRAARLERERVAGLVSLTLGKLDAAFGKKKATEAYRLFEELKSLSPSDSRIPEWARRLEALEPPFIERDGELILSLGGGVKMELVLIPAGDFLMGSPEDDESRSSDEGPQHRVRIAQPFYMGKYEVTQDQWLAVMGENPSYFKDCGGDCPVEQVSWEDCQAFCKKVSGRTGKKVQLPSEAQWEYACRAGSTGSYCFGDSDSSLGGYAWYDENSDGKTHSVGDKQANAWGLYDVHGNVWEWCEDWYHEDYSGAPTNGSAWLSGGKQDARVLRGGSWRYVQRGYLRSAYRDGSWPGYRYTYLGLRVGASLGT